MRNNATLHSNIVDYSKKYVLNPRSRRRERSLREDTHSPPTTHGPNHTETERERPREEPLSPTDRGETRTENLYEISEADDFLRGSVR
jgi:hypothetical protein